MDSRGRIALFVGQPDEYFQSRFLRGVKQRAFELDKDVCIFAMYKKYQDTEEREKGDSNIFRLANPACFDGIIILKDTIQTKGAVESLESSLRENYDGPVLVIDGKSEYYPSISLNGYAPIAELTRHLIEDHGVEDIAFLNGKKWHEKSKQYLAAFTDTMKAHGLTVSEDRVVEGDFWYKSGEQCLEYLLGTRRGLPEAVLCANDQMAIGLCKALYEKNLRVPEDVIVVGADSTMEGQTSPKSLTSYLSPAHEFGSYAVDRLFDIRDSLESKEFETRADILYGESCGCQKHNMPEYRIKRDRWETELSEGGFHSINNTLFENLLVQKNVMDYISMVYSYAYQLKEVDSFHLCLVSDIRHMGRVNAAMPRNEGYPKHMIHAIRYNSSRMENLVGLEETFDSSEILPDLYQKKDLPTAYYFSPVYFENTCFGYAVVSYCDAAKGYDEEYRDWIGTVSKGLESLRRQMIVEALQEQLSKLQTSKFAKSSVAYENLSPEEKAEYELVRDILDHNKLKYHFQPIVSAVDGSIYSYEALMRSNTEKPISPLAIIKYAGMMDRLTDIESATFRNVLGIVEMEKERLGSRKVFINSIPGIQVDDYDALSSKLSEHSDTVVVELTEEAQLGDDELGKLKEFFRRIHVDIAVDDYGTGYSNVSNLLRYMPDYVKIDRSLLSDIHNHPQKQHFVREIIGFCHDNDIKALAEGIETTEELRTVIHLGADLIQGYYTARPAADFLSRIDDRIAVEIKNYHQEKIDGKTKTIYIAGKTNRVSLLTLVKDECTDIVIGQPDMVYNDITIVGMPGMRTDVHIRVESGYNGRITLENAFLSNVKGRPCIELGEGAEVSCIIEGDNFLHGSGILVPETARLALEGNGNLSIELEQNINDYYGIGNDMSSRHGELSFLQDGRVTIIGNGSAGVGIGSGLGGKIHIFRGAYHIRINGVKGVGIGALHDNSEVSVYNCSLEVELSLSEGVGIGSYSKNAMASIEKTYLKCNGDAKKIVCVGTMLGEAAKVRITDSLVECFTRADYATCLGALDGATDIQVDTASMRMEVAGNQALVFGGYSEDTKVKLTSVDTKVDLHSAGKRDTYAKPENFIVENGRCEIIINDEKLDRDLVFKFQ